jgi:hypothetical protein
MRIKHLVVQNRTVALLLAALMIANSAHALDIEQFLTEPNSYSCNQDGGCEIPQPIAGNPDLIQLVEVATPDDDVPLAMDTITVTLAGETTGFTVTATYNPAYPFSVLNVDATAFPVDTYDVDSQITEP